MPKGDFQPTPQNGDAGELVKEFRESLGLSQTDFASYIHATSDIAKPGQGTLSNWESGKATVPGPLVVMAVDGLGPERVAEILQRRRTQLRVVGSQNLTVPYGLDLAAA